MTPAPRDIRAPEQRERDELRAAIPALMRGRVAQPGEKAPRDPPSHLWVVT